MVTPKNIISNVCSKIKSNYEFEEGFVGMKMDDIKHVQLSEIAELITKGTTPTTLGYEFQDSGVNFLKIECLDENGVFIKSKVAHISEECHEKLKRSQLKDGDILFSIAGAIGRVAIVTEEMLPANTNQALAIIRITNEEVYLPYIKLILTSTIVKDQFEKKKQGVAQLNLSLKDINEISIPLPNIEKQIELAELFGKVANVIAKRNEEIKSLDELIKARFVELFGDPINNPKGWKVVTIGDVVTEVKYGTSRPAVEGGKYPYLRMNNLTADGHLDLNDLKYIDIPEDEIEKCVVRKGDVLFNRTNSIELVGKTTVFDLQEDMVIAGYIIRVRLNEQILPEVLAQYMNLEALKEILRGMAKGAVNQANINAQELQSIKVYVPDMELQKQFIEAKQQIDKSKVVVQKALDEAQLLFDSLMQKYFG